MERPNGHSLTDSLQIESAISHTNADAMKSTLSIEDDMVQMGEAAAAIDRALTIDNNVPVPSINIVDHNRDELITLHYEPRALLPPPFISL